MNTEALQETIDSRTGNFYSRSKQSFWVKGETSKNFLHLIDIKTDCDYDTLLVKAQPDGTVCHTGADTCLDESNVPDDFLLTLEKIISTGEKTTRCWILYFFFICQKGMNAIAQKWERRRSK